MSKYLHTRSRLVSVHRLRIKCPVCGHKDNCAVNDDGTYCRRVRSDHQGKDGGWWHSNNEAQARPRPVPRVVETPKPAPVDKFKCDLIYQAFLRSLTLFTPHREDLTRRRLNELAIARGKFKSTPTEDEAARIVKMLSEDCDLSNVPGFYKDSSGWRMVKVPSGFFIPVLDRQGLIQGLQIRRDCLRHPKDNRYQWFSSRGYPLGTSSGAPVHIQNPERITATGRCIITEGALKAFVAAQRLSPDEGGLIALAGVSTFRENFGEQLKRAWPNLHTISIAFDADWQAKREVKCQLRRLIQSLKLARFDSISILSWEHEKGLDDYLLAESYEVVEAVA